MKKVFCGVLVAAAFITSVFAVDLSFRLSPTVLFPQKEYYTTEFGGFLQADVNLFNFLAVGLEGGFITTKPENMNSNLSFANFGLGLGGYFNPFSRLYLAAGGSFGLYNWNITIDNEPLSAQDLYWRAYGEAGFRINPSITIIGNGGYASYLTIGGDPINKGFFAGLGVKFNHDLGKKGTGGLKATLEQDSDVYPLFQQVYRQSPVGTLKIENIESAEVRNVKVSFRAGKYTSSALECENIPIIKKMGSISIPLYADFSSELLKFSENGKLSGEIVMEYDLLGKKKIAVQNVSLSVSNRNSYIWGNNDSLAAFVSSDTPEILEYAKYVAGVARNKLYTGMNRNLQFTAAIFEALRISGITYSHDKTSPYIEYHISDKTDTVQYPLQTMNYLGGDYDDLAILIASCLESVGVETAIMPVENDVILFVLTGIKASQAANHFADTEGLIADDSGVYFPLSMANFDNGFTQSRKEGVKIVKECKANPEAVYDFISVHAAWETYLPAVYTGSGSTLTKPSQTEIEKLTDACVKEYVSSDLNEVISKAKATGDSNKIGMAYVRAGRYADAKAEFNKAANNGSVSAMNNVANVLLMEKDYAGAAAQYKKVLQKDPENKTALKGLENANEKLE